MDKKKFIRIFKFMQREHICFSETTSEDGLAGVKASDHSEREISEREKFNNGLTFFFSL